MYYNMFSCRKIFLGDSGSLVLGVILGYLCLDVLILSPYDPVLFNGNKIIVLMALFSYPLVDTLRVFVVRISRKRSPFSADKNHIHHHLLRLGFSHRKATLLVIIYTLFITCTSFLITGININLLFILLLLVSVFVICLPSFLIKNEWILHSFIQNEVDSTPLLHCQLPGLAQECQKNRGGMIFVPPSSNDLGR